MVRTEIRLTPEQHAAAVALAEREGVSMSAVIRRGLDRVLAEDERQARVKGALAAVAALRGGSGHTDISINHDDYLAEDLLVRASARR